MLLECSGDEGPLKSLGSVSITGARRESVFEGDSTDCFLQINLAILWEKNCES